MKILKAVNYKNNILKSYWFYFILFSVDIYYIMQVRRVQCYFTSKYDLKVELFSHYQLYSSTLNRTIHYYFIPNWAALINKKIL